MNIKLLITGGTGYLASNIVCYLKKLSFYVCSGFSQRKHYCMASAQPECPLWHGAAN